MYSPSAVASCHQQLVFTNVPEKPVLEPLDQPNPSSTKNSAGKKPLLSSRSVPWNGIEYLRDKNPLTDIFPLKDITPLKDINLKKVRQPELAENKAGGEGRVSMPGELKPLSEQDLRLFEKNTRNPDAQHAFDIKQSVSVQEPGQVGYNVHSL